MSDDTPSIDDETLAALEAQVQGILDRIQASQAEAQRFREAAAAACPHGTLPLCVAIMFHQVDQRLEVALGHVEVARESAHHIAKWLPDFVEE